MSKYVVKSTPTLLYVDKYYYDNNRFKTHFLSALSSLFPAGERMFMKSLTNYIKIYPEFKSDIAIFCKEEKNHTETVELLTDITTLENYNINSNWLFLFEETQNTEVNVYDLSVEEVTYLLYSSFIFPKIIDGKLLVSPQEIAVSQSIVDNAVYNMPVLIPVQFYYLLSKAGLDEAIERLLPPLREENIIKYSMYKSYLTGARYYEFSKAYHMYLDIKEKILVVNPSLDFTLQQLKTLWTEAKES